MGQETSTRELINFATRKENIKRMKSKGIEELTKMFHESLEQSETFKYFMVKMFQEVVSFQLIEDAHSKLMSMNIESRQKAIREIVNRYIQFADFGYVFVVKNYL